jgi:hypothetical protein
MRMLAAALAAVLVLLGLVTWLHRPAAALEWAGWIQLVGVLLAMFWSVRLQAVAASHGARQARQVAGVFAANMHWVFRELSDACGKRNRADCAVHRRILEEILAQGREVTLQLLDGRSLAMVTSLRAIAVEALELMVQEDADPRWPLLQAHFEKRLPSIAAWLSATGNPPESSGPTDYAGLRTSFGQPGDPDS